MRATSTILGDQTGNGLIEKIIIIGVFVFLVAGGVLLIGGDATTTMDSQGQTVRCVNVSLGGTSGACGDEGTSTANSLTTQGFAFNNNPLPESGRTIGPGFAAPNRGFVANDRSLLPAPNTALAASETAQSSAAGPSPSFGGVGDGAAVGGGDEGLNIDDSAQGIVSNEGGQPAGEPIELAFVAGASTNDEPFVPSPIATDLNGDFDGDGISNTGVGAGGGVRAAAVGGGEGFDIDSAQGIVSDEGGQPAGEPIELAFVAGASTNDEPFVRTPPISTTADLIGDFDGDGIPDAEDPYPLIHNPTDPAFRADTDGDAIPDWADPEPTIAADRDGDGIPDSLDPPPRLGDRDGDGIQDVEDEFPDVALDTDGDGLPDRYDSNRYNEDPICYSEWVPCEFHPGRNEYLFDLGRQFPGSFTSDSDGDGILDAADPDFDFLERPPGYNYNYEFPDPNGDQDNDGIPNGVDPAPFDADDTDGDGIADGLDPEPLVPHQEPPEAPEEAPWNHDYDSDGIPDRQDPDRDGDGILDVDDPDIDNDGLLNEVDDNPLIANNLLDRPLETRTNFDYDDDGINDNRDPDYDWDEDGINNELDPQVNIPNEDADGDGLADNFNDPDPTTANSLDEWITITEWNLLQSPGHPDNDRDGDGIINSEDDDIDGDGTLNVDDVLPHNPEFTDELEAQPIVPRPGSITLSDFCQAALTSNGGTVLQTGEDGLVSSPGNVGAAVVSGCNANRVPIRTVAWGNPYFPEPGPDSTGAEFDALSDRAYAIYEDETASIDDVRRAANMAASAALSNVFQWDNYRARDRIIGIDQHSVEFYSLITTGGGIPAMAEMTIEERLAYVGVDVDTWNAAAPHLSVLYQVYEAEIAAEDDDCIFGFGGGDCLIDEIFVPVFAVVITVVTAGAAAPITAALGGGTIATITGTVVAGTLGSVATQLAFTGSVDWGAALESGALSALPSYTFENGVTVQITSGGKLTVGGDYANLTLDEEGFDALGLQVTENGQIIYSDENGVTLGVNTEDWDITCSQNGVCTAVYHPVQANTDEENAAIFDETGEEPPPGSQDSINVGTTINTQTGRIDIYGNVTLGSQSIRVAASNDGTIAIAGSSNGVNLGFSQTGNQSTLSFGYRSEDSPLSLNGTIGEGGLYSGEIRYLVEDEDGDIHVANLSLNQTGLLDAGVSHRLVDQDNCEFRNGEEVCQTIEVEYNVDGNGELEAEFTLRNEDGSEFSGSLDGDYTFQNAQGDTIRFEDGELVEIIEANAGGELVIDFSGDLPIVTIRGDYLEEYNSTPEVTEVIPDQEACFVAGTLVATRGGLVSIENVETGAKVHCANALTGTWDWCEVEETFIRDYQGDLIQISIVDDFIETTTEHPFWVVRGDELSGRPITGVHGAEEQTAGHGRWVEAQHLRVGDLLALGNENGQGHAVIEGLNTKPADTQVYNFNVDKFSTYSVGQSGVLVHNADYDYQEILDRVESVLESIGRSDVVAVLDTYTLRATPRQLGTLDVLVNMVDDESLSDIRRDSALSAIHSLLGRIGVTPFQDEDGDGITNIDDNFPDNLQFEQTFTERVLEKIVADALLGVITLVTDPELVATALLDFVEREFDQLASIYLENLEEHGLSGINPISAINEYLLTNGATLFDQLAETVEKCINDDEDACVNLAAGITQLAVGAAAVGLRVARGVGSPDTDSSGDLVFVEDVVDGDGIELGNPDLPTDSDWEALDNFGGAAARFPSAAQLDPSYLGEHLPDNPIWGGPGVTYLTVAERQRYRVTVSDGRLVDNSGRPVDTTSASTLHQGQGQAIYVMDTQGNIFISMDHQIGRFHHSSLVAGGDVAAAGEIVVRNGRVEMVNRGSGHYRPDRQQLQQMMDELERLGIEIGGIEVEQF